jgi:hypothetical protein
MIEIVVILASVVMVVAAFNLGRLHGQLRIGARVFHDNIPAAGIADYWAKSAQYRAMWNAFVGEKSPDRLPPLDEPKAAA